MLHYGINECLRSRRRRDRAQGLNRRWPPELCGRKAAALADRPASPRSELNWRRASARGPLLPISERHHGHHNKRAGTLIVLLIAAPSLWLAKEVSLVGPAAAALRQRDSAGRRGRGRGRGCLSEAFGPRSWRFKSPSIIIGSRRRPGAALLQINFFCMALSRDGNETKHPIGRPSPAASVGRPLGQYLVASVCKTIHWPPFVHRRHHHHHHRHHHQRLHRRLHHRRFVCSHAQDSRR
jgi:hypothetical protein